jgi:molybdopterin/thiamine biosynthesis adenylyltransferase
MKNLNSKKSCLFRITEADRKKLELLLFRRYPRQEWGTFFRFGFRITKWGVHITFVDAIAPLPGDLKRNSAIVEFTAGYILRAQLSLAESELAVGIIHSHPQNYTTHASSLDNDMDSYFADEFGMYSEGRPYASLRIAKTDDGQFSFSGELWYRGEVFQISEMLTIGKAIARDQNEFLKTTDLETNDQTLRMRELLGDQPVTRLQRSRVGIVGCSGTGSPAAHVLARADIRQFVLVDPEPFADSNHERFHASTWKDIGKNQPKVELLKRLILDIKRNPEVIMFRGNVLDEDVLDELLLCDVVLCCTDTQHSRAALSDYATHYLLPCIDSGVLMRAKGGALIEQVGEFARYSPDEPCAWCLDRINQKVLRWELMSEAERELRRLAALDAERRGLDGEQYWGGEPPRELTVGYMTTAVGAMQAGYAQGWITGAMQMPHQRFQFDIGLPELGVVPIDKERRAICSCGRTKGWSDQARADRSASKPRHWYANNAELNSMVV